MTTECKHPVKSRKEGPRIPTKIGKQPTEVCTVCKAWRIAPHVAGRQARFKIEPLPMEAA